MRSLSGTSLVAVTMLVVSAAVLSTAACGKVGELRGRKAFREANQAYTQQDYKKAAELYEATVAADPELEHGEPYFFLGNSYDNQFKPSRKGEADNDALLEKAIKNYQLASEKLAKSDKPDDKVLGRRSLEFLVAAYGADKLNDPARAEPVVQRMIQIEPGEPGNYFVLAKIYEDAGLYKEAEDVLVRAKQAKPSEPAVYTTLAGYYNRQGQFSKTIESLEERAQKESSNPEAFYMIATYYWDEAYRDSRLKEAEKIAYVQKGVEAIDRSLQIKPDYMEALVYKNLLFRLQANLEKDPVKQQALIKQADALRDKANELRKQKAAGLGD